MAATNSEFAVTSSTPAHNARSDTIDILLIDDDETIRQVLKTALQQCGYTLRDAANGRKALRLRNQFRFRLVITDLFMPEMDGLEIIMHHNRISPKVPLIAMTGGYVYSDPDDTLKMASALGSHASIKKPFELPAFLRLVHDLYALTDGNQKSSLRS
jgi:DNA-binding NtrC family response regulator